jgi:hypothetical protein
MARLTRRSIFVAVAVWILTSSPSLRADMTTEFNLIGAFGNVSAFVTGTVTIDFTTDTVSAIDLTVSTTGSNTTISTYTTIANQSQTTTEYSFDSTTTTTGTNPGIADTFTLNIPVTSLQGYAGGDITWYDVYATTDLPAPGTLSVPEPSTALLAAFGAAAFLAYGWSRHRRAQRLREAA